MEVYIFLRRLDDEGFEALLREERPDAALLRFWESLRPGFLAFERTRKVPSVKVGKDGLYRLAL